MRRGTEPRPRGPRVLYVCYAFPVLTQTFTAAEIRGLLDHGVDLSVVSCRPGEAGIATDLPVRHLLSPLGLGSLRAALGWALRRPARFGGLLAQIAVARYRDEPIRCWARGFLQFLWGAALADELRREGSRPHLHAQFVDAASTVAWVASRLIGGTFSFTNHTAYNPYLLRPKLRDAAVVFSISHFDRELLLRMARMEDRDNVRVVYQGVDLRAFEGLVRERPGDPLDVLCVAALRDKKGVDTLVRAVREAVDAGVRLRLTVVGDGPERSKIEDLVGELDLLSVVELAGSEPPDRVRERLRRADLFVLACRMAENGDLDGIPISLMEAMAAGVPVVSTRISGIPELVEDEEEGLLAVPDDVAGLAARIRRIATDPELAVRLRERAREKVARQHDVRNSTRAVADAFEETSR